MPESGNGKNRQVSGCSSLEQMRLFASVCMHVYTRIHACARVDGKKQPRHSQITLQRGSSLMFTTLSRVDYATLKWWHKVCSTCFGPLSEAQRKRTDTVTGDFARISIMCKLEMDELYWTVSCPCIPVWKHLFETYSTDFWPGIKSRFRFGSLAVKIEVCISSTNIFNTYVVNMILHITENEYFSYKI